MKRTNHNLQPPVLAPAARFKRAGKLLDVLNASKGNAQKLAKALIEVRTLQWDTREELRELRERQSVLAQQAAGIACLLRMLDNLEAMLATGFHDADNPYTVADLLNSEE